MPMTRKAIATALIWAAPGLALDTAAADEAIPPRTTPQIESSIFGTCTHFPNSWDHRAVLPMIEATGFKWIRDHVSWHEVEKEKGFFTSVPHPC
jgi:hypothetical protein